MNDADHPDPEHVPTVSKPLNGPRKGPWKPLLATLVFLLVVALIYFFGLSVLVPAD